MIAGNELRANLLIAIDYMLEIIEISNELFNRQYKQFSPRYRRLTDTQLKIAINKLLKMVDQYAN